MNRKGLDLLILGTPLPNKFFWCNLLGPLFITQRVFFCVSLCYWS